MDQESGRTQRPSVNLDRIEVIRPEAIDCAEDMILQTLKEAAAEYQAARKKGGKPKTPKTPKK